MQNTKICPSVILNRISLSPRLTKNQICVHFSYVPIEEIREWINIILRYYKTTLAKHLASCIIESRVKIDDIEIEILWINSKAHTKEICELIDFDLGFSIQNDQGNQKKSRFQTILNLFATRNLKSNLFEFIQKDNKIIECITVRSQNLYPETENLKLTEHGKLKVIMSEKVMDSLYVFITKSIQLTNIQTEKIKDLYLQYKNNIGVDINPKDDSFLKQNVPDEFLNTRRYCYERIKKGIVRFLIEIENSKSKDTKVKVFSYIYPDEDNLSVYEPYSYKGTVSKITAADSEYLIFYLQRVEEPKTPSFFFMRLDVGRLKKQEVSIGHHIFFSINYKRFHTKVVLWEKITYSTIDLIPEYISLFDLERYQTVPQTDHLFDKDKLFWIKKYLNKRDLSKLTMPKDIINALSGKSNDSSLESWVTKRTRNFNKYLNGLIGEYSCYSCVEELDENDDFEKITKKIHMNRFHIFKDNYTEFYHVLFYHSDARTNIFWYGDLLHSEINDIAYFQLLEYEGKPKSILDIRAIASK